MKGKDKNICSMRTEIHNLQTKPFLLLHLFLGYVHFRFSSRCELACNWSSFNTIIGFLVQFDNI